MADTKQGQYEAMFLISQSAATDLNGVVDHILNLLSRAGAELIALSKWDERRLAFEIDKQKRGVYLLCYFKAEKAAIAGLERDCNLSETIMRVLVIRADHLSTEEMAATDAREDLAVEARLRAEKAEKAAAAKDESVSIGAPTDDSEGQEDQAESKSPEPANAE